MKIHIHLNICDFIEMWTQKLDADYYIDAIFYISKSCEDRYKVEIKYWIHSLLYVRKHLKSTHELAYRQK